MDTASFLSFICLVVVASYCLQAHLGSKESIFGAAAYLILALHALLGAWKSFDSSTMPNIVVKIQNNIELFVDAFVISFSASELWTKRGLAEELVKLHQLIPLIPVFLYIFDREFKKVNDIIVLGAIISFTYASFLNDCIYGILSAFTYATNVFYVQSQTSMEMLSPKDLRNYVYSLFCLVLILTFHCRR